MIIQFLTAVIIIWLLLRILAKRRRAEMTNKEAILWVLLWLGVGVVVFCPQLTDKLAAGIGLQSAKGIDLVVYVAVAVVFYLVFRIFMRIEQLDHNITKIIRHLAINDKEIKR